MAKWQKHTPNLNWKNTTLLMIISLLFIMFLLPTLIVLPFKGDHAIETSTEQANRETTTDLEEIILESPFDVNILRTASNQVEQIPLENYVVNVVASEMPAEFESEALKAQALAARTYIVRFLLHDSEEQLAGDADVTDTVQHQVYKDNVELREVWGNDYHWKIAKITEAVAATQGKIITYSDQPITPAFFSTSNGYTENSEDYWQNELPYLRTVASPWDEELSPRFIDQTIFTEKELEEKLEIQLNGGNSNIQLERTESKRVAKATMAGSTFTGREIREKLNLPSNDFTITQKDNHYVFTTKGYGHGVGMSQYGANGMAKEGKTHEEIISYYYQGAEISTLEQATPTLLAKK